MKKLNLLLCAILVFIACEKENIPTEYTLTTSSVPESAGKLLPDNLSYYEGDNVQLTAIPGSEYVFNNWTGVTGETTIDASTGVATTTIKMDAAKTVVANFVKKKYNFVVTYVGQGTVTQEVVKTGASKYNSGSEIKLTANAASGWIFDKWQGDASGSDNPKTINVNSSKSITAVFKLDKVLTTIASGSGTVSKQLVSGQTYTVTATASANWVFEKWSGGLSGTENPKNITLTDDQTVIAIFKNNAAISRAADGKTIVAKPGTVAGTEFVLEGKTYTVLDNTMLTEWVAASAGSAYKDDSYGTPASDAKDLTLAVTTLCTNMEELFKGKTNFNADISTWDVSNVTNMKSMFEGATKFNQDVSKWDTNKVKNMDKMFKNATDFNQDLSKWCVVSLATAPTEFTDGSSCENDKKPVWGTWPGNPFIGDWVLDSWKVDANGTGIDLTNFHPYLESQEKVLCDDKSIELVKMNIAENSTIGTYTRVISICNADGSAMVPETETGYWLYNGDENSVKVSETQDFSSVEIYGLEYTADEKYFYVTFKQIMNTQGDTILITEVYKRDE